jgi:hypothetical protein
MRAGVPASRDSRVSGDSSPRARHDRKMQHRSATGALPRTRRFGPEAETTIPKGGTGYRGGIEPGDLTAHPMPVGPRLSP